MSKRITSQCIYILKHLSIYTLSFTSLTMLYYQNWNSHFKKQVQWSVSPPPPQNQCQCLDKIVSLSHMRDVTTYLTYVMQLDIPQSGSACFITFINHGSQFRSTRHFPKIFDRYFIFHLFISSKTPQKALLAACFRFLFCLAYYSSLKIGATCSCETSDDFQQTTRRNIPESRISHSEFLPCL
jgi:hypothetical protein